MYTELRAHSAFSFLRAASLPEDLAERAAALGYRAIAMGDRDGVYGAPRFHQAAKKCGVRAIIGAELTLAHGIVGRIEPVSLYLLAATRAGYRNLCRLITRTKLRAAKGASVAEWNDFDGATDGLLCLAGGSDGPLAAALAAHTPDSCHSIVSRLKGLFPGRLYIDIQRHLETPEARLNRALIDLAGNFGLPLAATNDVRHAEAEGRSLFDVLTCIREKTTLDAAGRRLACNAERHLKPPEEMTALFRDLPQALRNTESIAEQCQFTLTDLDYRFPEYPLPPGEDANHHLCQLTWNGARERYGRVSEKVRRQLDHELRIIGKLGLAGYFLIVWDIIRFCRERHILAQGRGSAANSAVCYSLGITAVDAVGMELLFERFLSEERGEWPDIDIDLPSGPQRERVIQYVYQRYGERGAAMTANVITYRSRSAVREVGKVLGFSPEQVGKLAKLLNRFEFRDRSDDLARQLVTGGIDPRAPRVGLLVDLVQRIRNLPRHLGQHSGGMVIAAGRLDDIVPLEPASMPGRVVVQWDKDDCADLGIIKVDLLGLGMMAVLEDTIPLVRRHEGIDIDLAHLPQDDAKTYAMLQKADTIGVFQVESRAQMATLPRLKPQHFYDLVVQVAIIRPGPIVGQMVHPYLNRRAGREPVTYPHPDLEPVLKRTLGVPLFQEQLLRIAMTVAGFTGGQAEELRRAMGFKRSAERMRQMEQRLHDGMARHGIAPQAREEIVRSITSFALYGFPESHAASFALLAYASAYLRAHHPAAFTCALLNNWPLGFYHPATLIKDAQRHGVRVLPIDITKSDWNCTLEPCPGSRDVRRTSGGTQAIRLGLRYVIGIREQAGRRIAAEREQSPYTSVADVVHRALLQKEEVEKLAYLGAFAALGMTRREALWQASAIIKEPLFRSARGAGLPPAPKESPAARKEDCPLPPMTLLERTLADFQGSGVTVGPHIMAHLRDTLRARGVIPAYQLAHVKDGRWVKMAGLVIVRQRPGTARGFCFITLEDETGTANAVVTPDLFQRYRGTIHTASLLQIEGPVQNVENVIHVRARRIEALELPRQPVSLIGSGYRMQIKPENEANEATAALPKSHDFR